MILTMRLMIGLLSPQSQPEAFRARSVMFEFHWQAHDKFGPMPSAADIWNLELEGPGTVLQAARVQCED